LTAVKIELKNLERRLGRTLDSSRDITLFVWTLGNFGIQYSTGR